MPTVLIICTILNGGIIKNEFAVIFWWLGFADPTLGTHISDTRFTFIDSHKDDKGKRG